MQDLDVVNTDKRFGRRNLPEEGKLVESDKTWPRISFFQETLPDTFHGGSSCNHSKFFFVSFFLDLLRTVLKSFFPGIILLLLSLSNNSMIWPDIVDLKVFLLFLLISLSASVREEGSD